jgi:hypothetical protein
VNAAMGRRAGLRLATRGPAWLGGFLGFAFGPIAGRRDSAATKNKGTRRKKQLLIIQSFPWLPDTFPRPLGDAPNNKLNPLCFKKFAQ